MVEPRAITSLNQENFSTANLFLNMSMWI